MFGKIGALWDLFRKGSEIADADKWKRRQITGTALAGVILALCYVGKTFGYEVPMDMDTATAIGGGVVAIVNVVLTIVTTRKVGLPPRPEADNGPRPEPDYRDSDQPRNDR